MKIAAESNAALTAGASSQRNMSVKIDNITVQSSATDSQGIARDIGNDLVNQIHLTASNLDDGVKY